LDLSHNDLTHQSFPEEFFDLSNLQELDLSWNRLTALPAPICMFIDIRKLDISGNEFADPRTQAKRITDLFPECEVIW